MTGSQNLVLEAVKELEYRPSCIFDSNNILQFEVSYSNTIMDQIPGETDIQYGGNRTYKYEINLSKEIQASTQTV